MRIDAVIHFAANAYVGESMTDPRKYFRNNTFNTLNLLDTMVERGVTRVVFSSTCATYGDPQRIPIDESHPQAPVNPYGESKLFVERILHWYGQRVRPALGRAAVLQRIRCRSRRRDRGGSRSGDAPHPARIDAALGRRPPVGVFGTDYPTPDGTAIRDYIHVIDLADAHVRALDYLAGGGVAPRSISAPGTATPCAR